MLDFVDQCEEMAAAYGCLPAQIMNMPWAHLRVWMESFQKRQRREQKLEAALRNMEMAQNLGASLGIAPGGGGEAPKPNVDFDLDDERVWDRLQAAGFPIEVRQANVR
jgi:hypothetical protein